MWNFRTEQRPFERTVSDQIAERKADRIGESEWQAFANGEPLSTTKDRLVGAVVVPITMATGWKTNEELNSTGEYNGKDF